MAYNAPSTRSTGDLINATIWNADIVANIIAVYAGGLSITSQAVGDILYASSTTQFARVAAVATGQVLVSAGTGTAPAWSSTPALTSVGIGTNAPDDLLHVYGGSAGSVTADVDARVVIEDNTTANLQFLVPAASNSYILFGDVDSNHAGRIGYEHASDSLNFFTGATQRMRIASSGYVGIGTAAPGTLLDVSNAAGAAQLTIQAGTGSSVTGEASLKLISRNSSSGSAPPAEIRNIWGGSNDSDLAFYTTTDGATMVEHMRINDVGNVGIGTSSPNHSLHVDGGTASTIAEFVTDTADAAVIKLTNENSTYQTWGFGVAGTAHAVADNAYYIRDETGGSNDFVITTAGYVGIGEPAPVHKLSLRATPFIHLGYNGALAATEMGGIKANSYDVENAGYSAAEVDFITGTVGYYGAIQFRTNNDNSTTSRAAVRMTIDQSGAVGIGTASPSFPLHISTIDSHIKIESTTGTNSTSVKATNTGGTLTFGIEENTGGNLVIGSSAYEGVIAHAGSYGLSLGTDNSRRLTISSGGTVNVVGTFTAGVKTFRIPHPLPEKNDTHHLIHGCLEGPRLDLIYRSTVTLVAGSATVDLDEAAGMTAGTWALLCRDAQVFTTNETGWFHVRGTVSGSTLTIECEEGTCTDTVSWMVVAERQDDAIKGQSSTDEDGHLILETLISPSE